MKPCAFDYVRAESVAHALDVLAQYGDEAKVLAGGQSLVPAMNFRLAQPAVLVDLNFVSELNGIDGRDSAVLIGAMTRQRAVEHSALIADRVPLLSETMPTIAHPQIRNRGTIGGSLAHADPSSELPAVARALEARMKVKSSKGERTVRADDFFVDLLTTALEPDELLVGVEFDQAQPGSGFAFQEVSRRHGDYALVGVASAVACDANGVCLSARVSLLSVGTGPVLSAACQQLVGEVPSDTLIEEAATATAEHEIEPESDIHASERYRRHLAKVLIRRTLGVAFERSRASQSHHSLEP